ncbi:MAG: hypothetical protein V3S68_05720, partial [Dehalococcoidia bacterium]
GSRVEGDEGAPILTLSLPGLCLKTVILRRQPKNLVPNLPSFTESNETPRSTRGDKERIARGPDSIEATGNYSYY